MKILISIILLPISLLVINNSYLYSKVSYFSEKEIKAEYQIFNFNDRVILDSMDLEYFSSSTDTIVVTLYKDNNFYFNKTKPQELYTDTVFNPNASKNIIHLDFTDLNLELKRQELIVEFKSINDKTRLIIDGLVDTVDCGNIIIGRNQKFIKDNTIINGNSNYRIKPYFQVVQDISDMNYFVNKDRIDSTLVFNNYSNIASADFNNDEFLDLFIENAIFLNDKNGNLIEEESLSLGDKEPSINQIYDLNDDGNLELIRIKSDGQVSIYSISSDLEIINEINANYSIVDNEIIKVLFLDADKDKKSEIILVNQNKIEILQNKYPLFESQTIELNSIASDASINLNTNRIIINSEDKTSENELIEINNNHFSRENINYSTNSVSFQNNNLLYEDEVEIKNEYNSFKLNRRVLEPKYIYMTNLENDLKNEVILVSSNNCQTNTIFSFNNEEFNDITESSNLKFLDLRNALFIDFNRDGYKEIVQLVDSNINVFELINKISNTNSRKTTNSNFNTLSINEKEFLRVHSTEEFGLNQVYGQIQLNNSDFSEGDVIQLNSKKYQFTDNQFVELSIESENIINEISVKISPNSGDLDFISSERIKFIQIINSIGQEIYTKDNVNKRIFSLNVNDINENLPQTVYYYVINTVSGNKTYKGQFAWVK